MRTRCSERERRGFTVPELLIWACLVSIVLGMVYALLSTIMRRGKWSCELSGAVQAGAIILHALEVDLANVISQPTEEDTVSIEDSDPDQQALSFSRRDPGTRIRFEDPDAAPIGIAVRYRAVRGADGYFQITRVQGTGSDEQVCAFSGIYAKEVRFTRTEVGAGKFVRVSMLLVDSQAGRSRVAPGVRSPLCVLTSLYAVPVEAN